MTKNLAIEYGWKLLKTMGNERRLHILYLLQDQEMSVGELEENLPLSQSALSQHLAVLRKDNLVSTRRVAQTIYYSIKNPKAIKVLQLLQEMFA